MAGRDARIRVATALLLECGLDPEPDHAARLADRASFEGLCRRLSALRRALVEAAQDCDQCSSVGGKPDCSCQQDARAQAMVF